MKKLLEIEASKQQIDELLNLYKQYGLVGDIYTAEAIYYGFMEIGSSPDTPKWNAKSALGAVLRVGYILGQRAERTRRA